MIDNNPLLQSSPYGVDSIKEALAYINLSDSPHLVNLAKIGVHVTNPYHNLTHELLVVYHALTAYYHSLPRGSLSDRQREKANYLVIAALFHDHNHSGGKTSDFENVERAISYVSNLPNLFPATKDIISDLIRKTEFTDGKFPHKPIMFVEQCLRDADLCMIYTSQGRQLLMELPREIDGGLSLYRRNPEARKSFLKKNKQFLESCEMFTEYGKLMKEFHLDRACQDLEDLVNYAVSANFVPGHTRWINE